MGSHVFDGPKQIVADALCSFEEALSFRIAEDHSRDAFLDNSSPAAILYFIYPRIALSLPL